MGASSAGAPTPTPHWRADHVILGGWQDSDADEDRIAMAARLLKLLGSNLSELHMAPCTPRKYNCSIVKCQAMDEPSASRIAFAFGITIRDNRPELAAAASCWPATPGLAPGVGMGAVAGAIARLGD